MQTDTLAPIFQFIGIELSRKAGFCREIRSSGFARILATQGITKQIEIFKKKASKCGANIELMFGREDGNSARCQGIPAAG